MQHLPPESLHPTTELPEPLKIISKLMLFLMWANLEEYEKSISLEQLSR
jgi:hypothetical protein